MPPRFDWQKVHDEIDHRLREARIAALIYDIERPVYAAYGIAVEEVKDIRDDVSFLLPLLMFGNDLAITLLIIGILLELLVIAALLYYRRTKVC